MGTAHDRMVDEEVAEANDATVQAVAREAGEWFERINVTREGEGERTIVSMKDGKPQWVEDLAYDAHGDFMPDDWKYERIRSALECIAESDDPEDAAHEWADAEVDVYTGDRLKWLASNLNRPSYCDEAAEEFGRGEGGPTDTVDRIGWGQYHEAREIYGSVLRSIEEEVEERS